MQTNVHEHEEEEHLVHAAPVCTTHIDLVSGISELCTSLKWIVRLGFTMLPFMLMFGAYLVLQIVDLKKSIAVQDVKLEQVCDKFKEHIQDYKDSLKKPNGNG